MSILWRVLWLRGKPVVVSLNCYWLHWTVAHVFFAGDSFQVSMTFLSVFSFRTRTIRRSLHLESHSRCRGRRCMMCTCLILFQNSTRSSCCPRRETFVFVIVCLLSTTRGIKRRYWELKFCVFCFCSGMLHKRSSIPLPRVTTKAWHAQHSSAYCSLHVACIARMRASRFSFAA